MLSDLCRLEENVLRTEFVRPDLICNPTKIILKSLLWKQVLQLVFEVDCAVLWSDQCARRPYGRLSRSSGTASQSKKSTKAGWAGARRAQSRHRILATTSANQRSIRLWLKRSVHGWRFNRNINVSSAEQNIHLCRGPVLYLTWCFSSVSRECHGQVWKGKGLSAPLPQC